LWRGGLRVQYAAALSGRWPKHMSPSASTSLLPDPGRALAQSWKNAEPTARFDHASERIGRIGRIWRAPRAGRAFRARATDIGRGEFEERSRITLHEYAHEWVERYQGTGRRGFREETRSEYRALLDKYALSHFPAQTKLTEITPRHIASFVGWLCEQTKRSATWEDPDRRVPLSDKTVRNALGPLKACLATARREGLIRHNPATDVALPHRARVDDDDDRPRPFPRIKGDDGEPIETMELVVEHVHESHRLMFELLAATGLRRSELLVLEGHHLALDGDRPHVKVRQRVRRRRGEVL
jgi:integrase